MGSGGRLGVGFAFVVLAVGYGCGDSDDEPSVTCGPGTVQQGGRCLPAAAGGSASGTGGADGDASSGSSGTSGAGGSVSTGSGGTDGAAGTADGAGGSAGGTGGTGASGGTGGVDDGGVTTQPFDCGSRDVSSATQLSGAVVASRTLSGLIHVTSTVQIRNEPTITIAPGTKFIVAEGAAFDIGTSGTRPTIIAQGTPEAPILFCGEAGSPGYWSHLIVHEGVTPESVLRNVLVADAGGTGAAAGLEVEAPITVQGVQVRGSGVAGVRATAFGPNSHTLIVTGSRGAAASLESGDAVDAFPARSDLSGNTVDAVLLTLSTLPRGTHFRNVGPRYRQIGDAIASAAASEAFIFDAGVVYELESKKKLDLGAARVEAVGTAAAPVVFRSQCEGAFCAGGGRLRIASESTGTSLTNVKLEGLGWREYTGSQDVYFGGFDIDATQPVTIDGLSVTGATGWAIAFNGRGGMTPQSRGLVGDATASILFSTADDMLTLPADSRVVSISSGGTITRSGTIRSFSGPDGVAGGSVGYHVSGLRVESGATLTVEAGVSFQFSPGTFLVFAAGSSGALAGTATNPIRFQQVNFITYGRWGGIVVQSPNVRIDNVQLPNGGDPWTGGERANILAFEPLTLTNSLITGSSGWGLLKRSSDATDYLQTNTFSSNTSGAIGALP